MAKIPFDKYYTSPRVAKWCIEKTKEIIGEENITEWFEPSAGSGSFSHQISGCRAYDLYPQHEYIEQADFLELELEYKKGRCFIGNPPFGAMGGKILKAFQEKCFKAGDYIAFIQPPSFYWNYSKFWKMEIVYSCLIETEYTNHKLWTSFTIYKRVADKSDFREKDIELEDIELINLTRSNKKGHKHPKNLEYDMCLTSFGTPFLEELKPYEKAGQILVRVKNESRKEEIIEFLRWLKRWNDRTKNLEKTNISAPSISKAQLRGIIRLCIPNIK